MNSNAPKPTPLGVSDDGAILLCRDWMVHLGATDTMVAKGPTQAICDLYSSRYIAWVQNAYGNLDVDPIMRAAQVCAADGRQAIIFKQGGVRPEPNDRLISVELRCSCTSPPMRSLKGQTRSELYCVASDWRQRRRPPFNAYLPPLKSRPVPP